MRLRLVLLASVLLALPPSAQPADSVLRTEPFSFDVAGNTLVGILDTPTARRPVSTVLLVHGYGETDVVEQNWFFDLRSRFAEAGIRTLVWDKPGCGQSEGEFDIDQPVQSSAEEVVAAVRALTARGGDGSETIGLWGISRAGWIAPLAMRDAPDLAFWISVSGVDDLENARYLLESNFRIEGRSEAETARLVGDWQTTFDAAWTGGTYDQYAAAASRLSRDPFVQYMGWGQVASRSQFDAYQNAFRAGERTVDPDEKLMVYVPAFRDLLSSLETPVLAIFGSEDSNVDWRRTRRLYQETIGQNPDASLAVEVFEGANHNLKLCEACGVREMAEQPWDTPYADGYHQAMIDWLIEHSFGLAAPE